MAKQKKITASRPIIEDGRQIGVETKSFSEASWAVLANAIPAYYGFAQDGPAKELPVAGKPTGRSKAEPAKEPVKTPAHDVNKD